MIIYKRKTKLRLLERKIKTLKEQLNPILSTSEYKDTMTQIQEYITKLDTDTQKKKIKKFHQDTNDYKQGL